ncbi:MAG TPA: hypothetical protein VH253_16100 [Phycisphaerae bacterium]|nr:hypothetical protein [Phycisphaerae bacterium]
MQPRLSLCASCLVLFALPAFSGCGRSLSRSPTIRFGPQQDDTRRRLGLPTVDSHWIATTFNNSVLWSAPEEVRDGPPMHFSKIVTYDGTHLIEESDFYSNGKSFEVRTPGRPPERRTVDVVVQFNYERAAAGQSPWSCALCQSATDEEISLPQAEKVLASWGLQRLNY